LISCSQRYKQWYLVNHSGIKVYYLGCSMWCSWSSILASNAAGYACYTKKRGSNWVGRVWKNIAHSMGDVLKYHLVCVL
jgi:hypothetical protein